MSAWLCNEEHIYELAHFYVSEVVATTMSAEKVARILYDANVDSLICRYGDKASDMPMDVPSHYHPIVTNTLHLACLLDCYSYQSCECDEWEESHAYDICARIRESLNLPKDYHNTADYEAAPWGFERAAYIKKNPAAFPLDNKQSS